MHIIMQWNERVGQRRGSLAAVPSAVFFVVPDFSAVFAHGGSMVSGVGSDVWNYN